MSHINHIGGGADAIGQFQAYLDRSRAARAARRLGTSAQPEEPLSFDSAIDPDREGHSEHEEPEDDASEDDSDRHELDAQA